MRLCVLLLWLMLAGCGFAQAPDVINTDGKSLEQRVAELETRTRAADSKKDATLFGGAALVSAALCALWAQNTRRNAVVWFIVGLCCVPVALIVLLVKNSNDNFERRTFGRAAHHPPPSP